MHAVSINEKSLDLIASNNGGVEPEIEPSPYGNGTAGTYFILPTDPNDHAEIVSIDEFFDNYQFYGPEAEDAFRPIRKLSQEEKDAPYVIDRGQLARMVACYSSQKFGAIAEQADFDVADEILNLIESKVMEQAERGPCPRCGGDHSWCQNVQPGEFGPE